MYSAASSCGRSSPPRSPPPAAAVAGRVRPPGLPDRRGPAPGDRLRASAATPGGSRYPDVHAIQTLAQMYAEGRGVPQDALTACALSNLGSGAAVYQHGERDPRTVAIQRQVEAHCVPLSTDERRDAMAANRCLQQAPAPRVLVESPIATRRARRARADRRANAVGRANTRSPRSSAARSRCRKCATSAWRRRGERSCRHGSSSRSTRGTRPSRTVVRLRTLEWSAIELTAKGRRPSRADRPRARRRLDVAGAKRPARVLETGQVRDAQVGRRPLADARSPGLHGIIGRPARAARLDRHPLNRLSAARFAAPASARSARLNSVPLVAHVVLREHVRPFPRRQRSAILEVAEKARRHLREVRLVSDAERVGNHDPQLRTRDLRRQRQQIRSCTAPSLSRAPPSAPPPSSPTAGTT